MSALLRLRSRILALAARLDWLPPLVARITLGWVFVESGWGKLHDLPRVVEFFRGLGIPAPEIQAPFAAATELVCGGLLLVGLLSRLASVPLIVVMIVAIKTAKADELAGLSELFGFIEYLYIVLSLYIAVNGPGALSIDALLVRWLAKPEDAALPAAGAVSARSARA